MKTIRIGYLVIEEISTGSIKDGYGGTEPEDVFNVNQINYIDVEVEDDFKCNPTSIEKLIEDINKNYDLKTDEFWDMPETERKKYPNFFNTIPHIPNYNAIISWSTFE